MANEQETTLAALQASLQMEIDGKKFYEKASKASKNQLGKELLKKLAAEEDIHRKVFQNIFDTLKSKKGWPDDKFHGDGGQGLRTIFARAIEDMDRDVKSIGTELEAIQTAMEMENKTYDYYKKQAADAVYEAQKGFYKALTAEERKHYLALVDYREYIVNPEGWFTKTEHHSLDGG